MPSSRYGNEVGSQCHDILEEVLIDGPTEKDIMLGRGAGCWSHPGNRLFRDMINDALPHCRRSDTRARKSEMFTQIYESILSKQGRFIKYNHQTKRWYQADKRQALEKISHAIRDRRACLTKENSDTENEFTSYRKDIIRSNASGNTFIEKHAVHPCSNNTAFSDLISKSTTNSIFSPPVKTNDFRHSLHSEVMRNFYPQDLPFTLQQRKVLAPFATSRYLNQELEYQYRIMLQKQVCFTLQEMESIQKCQSSQPISDVQSLWKTRQGFPNNHFIGNDLFMQKGTEFTNTAINAHAQTQLASNKDKNGNYLMALATLSTLIESVS